MVVVVMVRAKEEVCSRMTQDYDGVLHSNWAGPML